MSASRIAPIGLRLAVMAAVLHLATGSAWAGPVVLLRSGPLAPYEAAARGFRAAGPGAIVELSLADLPPAALERRLSELRPDAVVALGLKAALFARERLERTPIVFCAVHNYKESNLRGAWLTGVAVEIPPSAELAALLAVAPGARRVAILHGPDHAGPLREARAAASAAGVTLVDTPVASLSDLPKAARAAAARADALWMPADPAVATPEAFRFLRELSLAQKKPLLVFSDALVRAGALAGVAPDYVRAGALAAAAVQRIRAGERAEDIPIAVVRDARMVINSSTARALGLDFQADLARRAQVLP
jgi:putative ABC transport system substrate-binding protein